MRERIESRYFLINELPLNRLTTIVTEKKLIEYKIANRFELILYMRIQIYTTINIYRLTKLICS